ncbi:hypothetical protein EON65_30960 [archaeon]|nr:MAG: hypothetical protein EON65_30960 [archaeon]
MIILEADFNSGFFDSLIVIDNSILEDAIRKVSPRVAKLMKPNLHITGKGKVPGLNDVDEALFEKGNDFPAVQLHLW